MKIVLALHVCVVILFSAVELLGDTDLSILYASIIVAETAVLFWLIASMVKEGIKTEEKNQSGDKE